MKIKFELSESKIEGIKYYGKLILTADEDEISIDITVRENKEDKDLFVCLPSRKSNKDNKYYNDVFFSEDLYKKINKKLNKDFN